MDTHLYPTFQSAGSTLAEPGWRGLALLLASHAAREVMLGLAARLGARGPVRVLDGGNRFNALVVARLLRGLAGSGMQPALERIRLARAFTCYQMAVLLADTPAEGAPILVLDLLDTFYDESARLHERRRLLRGCVAHLQRLAAAAPVVVSVRPPLPPQADPLGLVQIVQEAAGQVYFQEEIAPPQPLRLF